MIGVYGGTFNPVHFGHLRTALEVKETLGLDELRMIPCRLPPHRDSPEVPAEMRWQMLCLALAGVPGLIADRRELDREGPSYMVDTLSSLQDEFPERPLLLFIGTDAFAGLATWHCWRQLFDYAHVVVMTRPGYRCGLLDDFLSQRLAEQTRTLRENFAGRLFFQPVTRLEISATAIRTLIAGGRDPRFLMPDSVIAYIRQHHLYRNKPQEIECKQKN